MSKVRQLEINTGTIAVFNDIHIGIQDDPALKLCIELCESIGVDEVLANGDIADCAAVSPHKSKKARALATTGQLQEEIASGRYFLDWLSTRPSIFGVGNHEDWINDAALETGMVGTLTVRSALDISPFVEVLPHGYQIRIGSLVIEHGDLLLGRGSGGTNVAQSILGKYPDQSTVAGHFHRESVATRTSPDSGGIMRSRCAVSLGHLSHVHKHTEYAGRAPNWQQGMGIIRVYSVDGKPRFTITPVAIHRDRYNRPFAEYGGKVYR